MLSFSQPLSFMGTKKIKDKIDRENIIATRNCGMAADSDDPETRIAGGSHRRNRFTDQSNIRVAGGKAAGPKPIKANYDADDARIVDLKQQGWTDEYVARKLAEEGRIRYVGRTVGSRWLRIRKALEAKEEEILEDEMSDWHDGEDESLEQAVKEIDAKIDKEIAKLREKKWLQVATHVADLIQKKKYTQRLCRERYESLMDGTALLPIELDSDQEGRAELRISRITTNKRLREEAAAAQELEDQQRTAARMAKKEARAANVIVRITKAQQKKIDEEKIANMRMESVAARRAQKAIMANWTAYMKVDARWATRKQAGERRATNRLLGLPLGYRPSRYNYGDDNEVEIDGEANATDHAGDEVEEEGSEGGDAVAEDEDQANNYASTVAASTTSDSVSDNPRPRKKLLRNPSSSPPTSVRDSKSASPKHIAPGEAIATEKTRASPRSVMTLAELTMVLASRDLPRASDTETHEQVVARLCEEDGLLTQQALRAVLKASGLNAGGKKEAMIERLQVYDASRSAAEEGNL